MERAPIIVGVDGSPASLEAVRWAAWQSQRTAAPLIVAHAYTPAEPPVGQEAPFRAVQESWHRSRATRWLREALDESAALPYRIRLVVAEGGLEPVLEALIGAEGLLVLGSPSGPELLEWCTEQVRCPVVIVPTTRPEGASRVEHTAERTGRLDEVSA